MGEWEGGGEVHSRQVKGPCSLFFQFYFTYFTRLSAAGHGVWTWYCGRSLNSSAEKILLLDKVEDIPV